jgi:succinate-semialdehyde dehydrogenase/glutarate-semialdehyde dehydrogenase
MDDFHQAAEDVKRLETASHPSEHTDKRVHTIREPHGVYGIVTPWNFPTSIPAQYLAPGLAAGNAFVWVPAPSTSVVAVQLAAVLANTALPEGAINLVVGPGPVVGNEAVSNDGVDAVGFTGSPETGEEIARAAGTRPALLELGGNGPTIVFADADLEAAAEQTAVGCFANAGQNCAASERVFVHEDVADAFVDALVVHAEETVLGDPTAPETTMGPLNNESVATKMDRHVEDAREGGATVVRKGGRREDAPTDLYYEPVVLTDVTSGMAVYREESFGPIAPVSTFSAVEEAIEMTNEIDLGLSAAVFTSDLRRTYEVAERIEAGVVNVNETSAFWEHHSPFGGYTGTDSGKGRVGGRYGLEEMTQLKTINVDVGSGPPTRRG